MRTKHREHLEQPGIQQVLPAEEGHAEARFHPLQLAAILVQETAKSRDVGGRDRADLLFHPRDVRGRVEHAATAKDDPVLRIESHHFHLRAERCSCRCEDLLEHPWVEKEGRPEVEFEAVRFDRRRSPSDRRKALENFNLHARSREQERGRQTARSRTDDDDVFAHHQNFVFTPQARSAHQPRAASKAMKPPLSQRITAPNCESGQSSHPPTAKRSAPAARRTRPLVAIFFVNRGME